MGKRIIRLLPLSLIMLFLPGCASVGDKVASISTVYCVAAVLSFVLLAVYCGIAKKPDAWYLLLFASVVVVNIGYFALAVSEGLGEALLANRISYLGSVFLPLSMLIIIINSTHIRCGKWLPGVLLGIAVVMFFIAASPGYLTIYYKNVSFEVVGGVATLIKEYGPLHSLYLVYLLGCFGAMIVTIIYATVKNKIDSTAYAVIIAIAVFVNLGVWMLEQLVDIGFEFLSISYVISECFLLGLNILMAEAEKQRRTAEHQPQEESLNFNPNETLSTAKEDNVPEEYSEAAKLFVDGLSRLTPKEKELYECYIAGLTTDVIMKKLSIKENTLKFHSKNLYGKLGVKSRKQLFALYKLIS